MNRANFNQIQNRYQWNVNNDNAKRLHHFRQFNDYNSCKYPNSNRPQVPSRNRIGSRSHSYSSSERQHQSHTRRSNYNNGSTRGPTQSLERDGRRPSRRRDCYGVSKKSSNRQPRQKIIQPLSTIDQTEYLDIRPAFNFPTIPANENINYVLKDPKTKPSTVISYIFKCEPRLFVSVFMNKISLNICFKTPCHRFNVYIHQARTHLSNGSWMICNASSKELAKEGLCARLIAFCFNEENLARQTLHQFCDKKRVSSKGYNFFADCDFVDVSSESTPEPEKPTSDHQASVSVSSKTVMINCDKDRTSLSQVNSFYTEYNHQPHSSSQASSFSNDSVVELPGNFEPQEEESVEINDQEEKIKVHCSNETSSGLLTTVPVHDEFSSLQLSSSQSPPLIKSVYCATDPEDFANDDLIERHNALKKKLRKLEADLRSLKEKEDCNRSTIEQIRVSEQDKDLVKQWRERRNRQQSVDELTCFPRRLPYSVLIFTKFSFVHNVRCEQIVSNNKKFSQQNPVVSFHVELVLNEKVSFYGYSSNPRHAMDNAIIVALNTCNYVNLFERVIPRHLADDGSYLLNTFVSFFDSATFQPTVECEWKQSDQLEITLNCGNSSFIFERSAAAKCELKVARAVVLSFMQDKWDYIII